jgi:hypothetical protein
MERLAASTAAAAISSAIARWIACARDLRAGLSMP